MAVYRLDDDDLWFPDPHYGEPDGLVAVGGDLSEERLMLAYSYGFFPWFSWRCKKMPYWYCPMDRFVIFPKEIHVSHSMRQLMKQGKYEVTMGRDFEGVIRGCSTADGRDQERGAWLGEDMIAAYTRLHHLGLATSVEVWEKNASEGQEESAAEVQDKPAEEVQERRLVGGLYGVRLKKAFFGESMFSLVPSASKLALIHLARTLEQAGGKLIDCQFETPHLLSMGGRHISYDEYMSIIHNSYERPHLD